MTTEFVPFRKIGRLSREMVVTEKLDGTNGVIFIGEPNSALDFSRQAGGYPGEFLVGSRSRWIPAGEDNHGFSTWAYQHKDELIAGLGPGWHHGEWWGKGIARGYGINEKRFSLFNTSLWGPQSDGAGNWICGRHPACCHVVPMLYRGAFDTADVTKVMAALKYTGSLAAPGFMQPEGVVVFHPQGNFLLKKTFEKDDAGKDHGRMRFLRPDLFGPCYKQQDGT
jgi:RNA ligase